MSFWSPQYVKDVSIMERMQRRITRKLLEIECLCNEERLDTLGLFPLEQKNLRGR